MDSEDYMDPDEYHMWEDIEPTIQSQPPDRVNGHVCGKWPPSPNLGRNLFPSAEVFRD
jgi:hypothetical protein